MKNFKNPIIILFILYFFVSSSVFSQEQEQQENVQTNDSTAQSDDLAEPNSKERNIKFVSTFDDRLHFGEISFFKRYESNGKGEFLDVNVPLKNNSPENIDYKIYVLVATEFDFDKKRFPELKSKDWLLLKNSFGNSKFIENIKLIPFKDITEKTIMGDIKHASITAKYYKNLDLGIQPFYPINVTFQETIAYLIKNTENALKFTLQGSLYPDKLSDKNEDRTIFKNRFETTIITHHYYPYKDKNMNYNKIAVLIFNNEKDSRFKDRLVYKRIMNIKIKPKANR